MSDSGQIRSEAKGGRSFVKRAFPYVLGLAAVLALGFVISPFDATVRGDFGIRAFTRTFNSAAAGLAVGAATFVIDGGSALLVALGLSANPTLTSRLDSWTTRILNPTTRKKLKGEASTTSGASSTLSDVSLALGVGAGAVILKHPTASRNRWIRLAAIYTIMNSVVFGTIGWMVAGGANFMADAGFGWLRDGLIRWVPEPLVWTAIFVATVLGPFLYGEWLDRTDADQ